MSSQGRILILPSWYPPDGGYFFKEHSEAIAGMGWQTDVLVNRVIGVRKLLQTGIGSLRGYRVSRENQLRVIRAVYLKIPGNELANILRWSKKTSRLYARYARSFGHPDLILCHSVTWAGVAAALIRERHGIPYVVVEHRSFFVWSTPQARAMVRPFYLPFFERAYRGCETLVPVSESLLRGLRELLPWVEEKTQVIPNMIREDMFLPPREGRNTDPFVFFWAGRLEHVKGIDLLLEAVRRLKEQSNTNFTVRLAGKGNLRKELEELAVELGVGDRVRFLGRISREQMQEEMRQACCFVLPTRYEAFGAVLIEAMASGLPVIATRSGGPDSIVTEETGLLVDVESAGQLAAAMRGMIDNYKRYSPEHIRDQALARFGQTGVMAQYHRLFLEITGQ
jgi:glycosyltransferase involved in cell wall biosynthesis